MRKLFVLVAIFAMAPVASAVTGTLTDTGTAVDLTLTGQTVDGYLAIVIEAPGTLSNFAPGAAAPSIRNSFGPIAVGADNGEVYGFGTAVGEAYLDGVWLSADWSAAVTVWVSAYETLDTVNWTLLDRIEVPEPMTVALLGLGGLFMLRRRK